MIRKFAAILLLAGIASIFMGLLFTYEPDAELNTTARYYAERTAADIGATNIVTAIVVTYRGLDTLGEVTVLFLTAAIVGLVLAHGRRRTSDKRRLAPVGELLATGSRFLAPLIILLGVYVFANGHLTPGGGFQGGAIIASGVLLILLADPCRCLSHRVIDTVESVSGLFYVGIAILGIVLAGGFLDSHLLPRGELGALFSAGAIPLIYALIGLKVGAEFSSILAHLSETEEL